MKLHEMSGLKKTVFDKLVLSMVTLYQQQQTDKVEAVKPKATKRAKSFIESVEEKAKGSYALTIQLYSMFCLVKDKSK